VLDFDGDGDVDVATTSSTGTFVSVLPNDGDGVFGQPILFDTGYSQTWGIWACDMTNDGRQDLVVGARGEQKAFVLADRGDFATLGEQASGGDVWQIACGDVDADADADVTIANGLSNRGSVLLGDGRGRLGPPVTYPSDPWTTSTDLGDLDGDGDLDWILSSYFGDWYVYTNDGDGSFTFRETMTSPIAASCAVMFDIENDGDLDLALIDEDADQVLVRENRQLGPIPCADVRQVYAACTQSALSVHLAMHNALHNGKRVTFRVAGVAYDATIVGEEAVLTLPPLDGNLVMVELEEPAGCARAFHVQCP
jgi:hypothetical protein